MIKSFPGDDDIVSPGVFEEVYKKLFLLRKNFAKGKAHCIKHVKHNTGCDDCKVNVGTLEAFLVKQLSRLDLKAKVPYVRHIKTSDGFKFLSRHSSKCMMKLDDLQQNVIERIRIVLLNFLISFSSDRIS